ncbi:MAG: rhodanese-like domain-containing protein, partial [Actinomycetota bacterium]|nr:rhodanese-like domain-containing protein [Actinomycetota bacterium]
TDRESLEAVCAEELLQKTREESVVLLDVRPEEEYRAGHIPGARSVPMERLEAYLEEIPKDREVVAYCRGPYCVFSDEAVKLLEARGYRASRLTEGFPEWRAAGLPVEN